MFVLRLERRCLVHGAFSVWSIVGWYFLRPCRASQRNVRNASRRLRRFCNLSFLCLLAAFLAAVACSCCSCQLYVYSLLSFFFFPQQRRNDPALLFLRAFLSQGNAASDVFTDLFIKITAVESRPVECDTFVVS